MVLFLCQMSGCVNFCKGRAHFDATFPIFLQRYILWTSTGVSVSGRDLAGLLQILYTCTGKSDNFHGHFLLLKLCLCISNTEMPCSKNLASDKVRVFLR